MGTTILTATATDLAGNGRSGTASFVVRATPSSLCLLTKQFVQGSPRYAALTPLQRTVVTALADALCQKLDALVPRMTPAQKTAVIRAYDVGVQALVPAVWLTQPQANTLIGLAGSL